MFAAAGVWPLLAFLAAGADRTVREELAEALGVPAGEAVEQAAVRARDLLDVLGAVPGVGAAIGLWTRDDLLLEARWLAAVGAGTHERLTGDPAVDRDRLDAWADSRTDGMIRSMPLEPLRSTRLVLAGALTVRTRWQQAFRPSRHQAAAGPWAGRPLAALHLDSSALFDRLAVAETAAGPVTEVRLPGDTDIDVHLVIGPAAAPLGAVLAAGLDLLDGRAVRTPAAALAHGDEWPGLTVRSADSAQPGDRLALTTVPFTVRTRHDLLQHARLLGLRTASRVGSFTGITSTEPLVVTQAAQSATATFGGLGFEAGAVTAVGMSRGAAARRPGHRVTVADAVFDRPFAFLAVHRTSGLAIAAGWVGEPAEHEDVS
ncbi:serpin family protein [Kitasatospora sp. NBC_01539]|uniref:serpin family protein n=1 Tax=Kitasatospora sp. NBC_01539 TaxID=2903577 RepID=UPI0038601BB1